MDYTFLEKLIKDEGDYHEWTNTFKCKIRRNGFNCWCGYVIIEDSILSNYISDDDISNLKCHGGITFRENVGNGLEIGFDCCHFGDLIPMVGNIYNYESTYRDKNFAIDEVNNIVDQLNDIISKSRNYRIDLLI